MHKNRSHLAPATSNTVYSNSRTVPQMQFPAHNRSVEVCKIIAMCSDLSDRNIIISNHYNGVHCINMISERRVKYSCSPREGVVMTA